MSGSTCATPTASPPPGSRPRAASPATTAARAISGVPGTAAPVNLFFEGTAGSTCGALLPTGRACDDFTAADGRTVRATCVDNGMPTVVLLASEMGITGRETPAELEADQRLRADLEAVRLAAGPLMNLGDVARATVPKLTMVSAPEAGGAVSTRTFIPHRCHDAIGVLGAVSVATACLLDGSPAAEVCSAPARHRPRRRRPPIGVIEHPTGDFDCVFELDGQRRDRESWRAADGPEAVRRPRVPPGGPVNDNAASTGAGAPRGRRR